MVSCHDGRIIAFFLVLSLNGTMTCDRQAQGHFSLVVWRLLTGLDDTAATPLCYLLCGLFCETG